eukprot:949399-Alexandrium_andersonii.AAC.1
MLRARPQKAAEHVDVLRGRVHRALPTEGRISVGRLRAPRVPRREVPKRPEAAKLLVPRALGRLMEVEHGA